MTRLPIIAALVLLAAPAPAFAAEALCVQSDKALVIAEEREGEVGMNILARAPAKGKIACQYEEREGDWIIGKPDDPLYYHDLRGQYLILTRSTGPDENLVILDVANRGVVVDEWIGDSFIVNDADVTFWQRFEDGNAENCPEFEEYSSYGFGASIAREQAFDLATGTITATGAERCSATQ